MKYSCIKTYLNRHEAEMDQALLESCGFLARISADDAGGMQPHLLYRAKGARLLVPEDQAEEAKALLDASPDEDAGP
ncbi:hypothetical protein ACFL5M_06545 [Candidatus Neomarinimicrobiota bacterium]